MGQLYSSDCVSLKIHLSPENYAKLVNETYTVVRTSGALQPGFHIPKETHECDKGGFRPSAHATRMPGAGQLRIFLATNPVVCAEGCDEKHEHNDHVCGWRICSEGERTFWPTGLVGDEREAWFKWLDEAVSHIDFPTHESRQKHRDEMERKRMDAAAEAAALKGNP